MGENFVIRWHDQRPAAGRPSAAAAEWVILDAAGGLVSGPEQGSLATAAERAAGLRVLVLVPGELVLRLRADVPVRGAGRISQALPFALEDQLADDVEDLHFAAGPRDVDGRVPVAVVRRELLDQWLLELRSAGIEPFAIYADSDGLLDVPGTATLLVEPARAMFRDPGGDAVVMEPESVAGLLELWAAQTRARAAEEDEILPLNLQVYDARHAGPEADTEATDGAPWEIPGMEGRSLDVRLLADGALPRLAAGIVAHPGLTLLQGSYLRRSSLASHWPRWRSAAALAAALAAVLLTVAIIDLVRLNREVAALDRTVAEAARYTFPDAGDVSDPRRLLEDRLRIRGVAGGNVADRQFLETLRIVAGALDASADARLESLSYRGGVMELQIRAPSADTLDSIRRTVMGDGRLKAEIQSANADDDQIQGRIRISGSGA